MEEATEVPSHARESSSGRVKNKTPAKIQITAEQLIREAYERRQTAPTLPKHQIADHEELLDFQREQRKQYEMRIVRNRMHAPLWFRYAKWEEDQQEFVRARSIFERAIDNDYRNPSVWLKYAEMEMRNRFVNHARNVLDRAVALLPRVNDVWMKYAHMEEMLEQVESARLVYSRWMKWFPKPQAYFSFIRFELRSGNIARARDVYGMLIAAHRTAHSYVKFAKFEERNRELAKARYVYEAASTELPQEQITPELLLSFAKFEERRKQPERARAIYRFANEKFPDIGTEIERSYTRFEKQQGDREALDDLLISKKRASYQKHLEENRHNYDTWFDLLHMEERAAKAEVVRSTYEKAVSCIPPVATKQAWIKYICLWLSYAVWEETVAKSLPAAINVYKRCTAAVPKGHKLFSFEHVWLLYAKAHIRNHDTASARKVFGTALGVLPGVHELYQAYIELETALGEVERARNVCQVWISRHPTYSVAFLSFAAMEAKLGEFGRTLLILELAISIEGLDNKCGVWSKVAEILVESEGQEHAVKKFDEYVKKHSIKDTWVAYLDMLKQTQAAPKVVRKVYERAIAALKEQSMITGAKGAQHGDAALDIGEQWLKWEGELGDEAQTSDDEDQIARARRMIPRRVKRQKIVNGVDTTEWNIIFPDEQVATQNTTSLLLAAALKWNTDTAAGNGT